MIHRKSKHKLQLIFSLLTVVAIFTIFSLSEAEGSSNVVVLTPNDSIPENYRPISGSTVYDTKTLDMWHWSEGYWMVGNIAASQIKITDHEFGLTDGQIAPSETASFNFLLPSSVRNEIAKGKKIAIKVDTTGGLDFNDLIGEGDMSFSASSNQLNLVLKPKFNVIPHGELNFKEHYGIDVHHIPFIESKFGCHLYSVLGNDVYEAQAYGWVDKSNKYSTHPPNYQITPAMVDNPSGALKSGFSISTSQGPVQSGGLNIGGPGVFKKGGAVGLHFEFPLSVTFYEVEEAPVIVPDEINALLSLPGNAFVGETYEAKDISPSLPEGKALDYTKLEKKVMGSWQTVSGWDCTELGSSIEQIADKVGTVEYKLTIVCKGGSSASHERSIDILEKEALALNATAVLHLPSETYKGHSVIAEDASTYDAEGEIYSAKRAYAERIASNSFSIITGGGGSLSKLTSTTQRATFNSLGSYSIRLTASPKDGASDTDIKSIDVLPTPAIKDYLGGKQKQNRKQVIDLKIATYPTSKLTSLYVEIERPSNGEKVKLIHKLGSGTNTLVNSETIKTRPIEILPSDEYFTNCKLEFLTKNTSAEEYRYTVYAKDDEGNVDEITKAFWVDPDLPPVANIDLESSFIRQEGSDNAPIRVEDKTTTDGDQVERAWYYRPVEAGQDESEKGDWIEITTGSPGYGDYSFGTAKEIEFYKKHVGLLEVKLLAKDLWIDETLEEYVTGEDRLADEVIKVTEVINIAPVVSLKPISLKTADITILAGGSAEYERVKENIKRIETGLLEEGISAKINIDKMMPLAAESNTSGAGKTLEVTTPLGHYGEWTFYEDKNFITDDESFYKIDASWPDGSPSGRPEPPYTISCWDWAAEGTGDTKWTFTFGNSLMHVPALKEGPYFVQDDSNKYLYFVADGKTLMLTKDNGSFLTVADMEFGKNTYWEEDSIYTIKKHGIYKISTFTGETSKIYSNHIFEGDYRRIGGKIHFVTGTLGKMYRGIFDMKAQTVSLEPLNYTLPENHENLETYAYIDVDGKIILSSKSHNRVEGELITAYYITTASVFDRNNSCLYDTNLYSSNLKNFHIISPIYDEGGICNYLVCTYENRNTNYAELHRIRDGYFKSTYLSGNATDSSRVPFARELDGKVYFCNGAYYVDVQASGSYYAYPQRLKAFVFDPDADTVKAGDYYTELGFDLNTIEYGYSSDAITAVQASYNNVAGDGYSLNQIIKWDQTLQQILNRYVEKHIKGEEDINAFVIYDETSPSSLYTSSIIAAFESRMKANNGKLITASRNDIVGSGLLTEIMPSKDEKKDVLCISVEEGKIGTLTKYYDLDPNKRYYYEYEVSRSNLSDNEDVLTAEHVVNGTKGAYFTPGGYKTVVSHYEDFEDKENIDSFFQFERIINRNIGGIIKQEEVIEDGYYKGGNVVITENSNVLRVDEGELSQITFTVPQDTYGMLFLEYLILKKGNLSNGQNVMQCYIKIDGEPWDSFNPQSKNKGNYSHPRLLSPGDHTISFYASASGRRNMDDRAKMWLDSIRLDIVEFADEEPSGSVVKDRVIKEDMPGDYTYVNGEFKSLPTVPIYGEVTNADAISGEIGEEGTNTVLIDNYDYRKSFIVNIPEGKTAMLPRVPTKSIVNDNRNSRVTYTVGGYGWVVQGQGDYTWLSMSQWPLDGVINSPDFDKTTIVQGSMSSASGYFLGIDMTMVDDENVGWKEKAHFTAEQDGSKSFFLQKGQYQGVNLIISLPEGQHRIKNFKLYTMENGVKTYTGHESFEDSALLSKWVVENAAAAIISEEIPEKDEPGLVYKKGEAVGYSINYYDFEGDPSKRQYWKYAHTPFNDGEHPDAAVILDADNEPIKITGKILNAHIDRFYIDGKYTVEHWQEDNTTRPVKLAGNPDYDKLSNVESITFYIQGGGSAPWIKSIKTDPADVKEGDNFKIKVEVDDAEKDTLHLITEVYRDGKLIYTHRKANIKANASGVYPVTTTDNVPGVAVTGKYEIVCTVRDDTGAGIDSFKFTVTSEGKITGRVNHTDLWDKNRKKYNLYFFKEEYNKAVSYDEYMSMCLPRKRGTNVFWAGEKFMLSAHVGGVPQKVTAAIKDYPSYITVLKDSGEKNGQGESVYLGDLWDSNMLGKWGKADPDRLEFIFTAEYAGGMVKTFEEEIIVDTGIEYWLLHRLW